MIYLLYIVRDKNKLVMFKGNVFKVIDNNELPTQKMKDWFNFSYNLPSETMDGLELDDFYSRMKQDFIDDFGSELNGLTYMEICQLFDNLCC